MLYFFAKICVKREIFFSRYCQFFAPWIKIRESAFFRGFGEAKMLQIQRIRIGGS